MKKLFPLILILFINLLHISSSNAQHTHPPTIHLIGEQHQNKRCIETKNNLKKLAANNSIILALEGLSYQSPEKSPNIYGLEDPLIQKLITNSQLLTIFLMHAVIQDLSQYPLNEKLIHQQKEIIYNFFIHIETRLDDLIYAITDTISVETTSIYQNNQELLTDIKNKILTPLSQNTNIIPTLLENHSLDNPFFLNINDNIFLWITLFIDTTNYYLNITQDQVPQEFINYFKNFNNEANNYFKQTNQPKKLTHIYVFIHQLYNLFNLIDNELIYNLRNTIFLKNTLTLLQSLNLSEKPFYLIVGTNHIPFLYKSFIDLSYNTEINDYGQVTHNEDLAITKQEI